MEDKIRIDKWLWTVRIFKSRTLATESVKGGKVKINGQSVKASYQVQRGEIIEVKKNGFAFQFRVKDILKSRVSAPLAQACYDDITPAEELNKYNDWFIGKGAPERRDRGAGRPTKRERREIEGFKGSWDWDDSD